MIPEALLPLFTACRLLEIPICIAGGYAACPEKASDIDVWIKTKSLLPQTVADVLNGQFGHRTWTTLPADARNAWGFRNRRQLAHTRSDKFRMPGLDKPVEVMLTDSLPQELIAGFDISTHAVAITSTGTYRAKFWTPVDEAPVINEDAMESHGYNGMRASGETKQRLAMIKARYADLRPPLSKIRTFLGKVVGATAAVLLACSTASAQGALTKASTDGPGIVRFLDSLTPAPENPVVRTVADGASYVTWGANLALDAKAAYDSPNKVRAYTTMGVRLATTATAVWAIKKAVHRTRPCAKGLSGAGGYDTACAPDNPDTSFLSGHTAFAFEAIDFTEGQHAQLRITFAVATAAGRIIAKKHWLTDTLAAAGLGLGIGRIR